MEALDIALRARLDVSAASGLVIDGGRLWVVADDEHALSGYDDDGRRVERVALLDDAPLPREHRARKARKADFEALARIAPGWLFALGSGSTPARCRAVSVRGGRATVVDLAGLYARLERELAGLNIEGAAVVGDALVLLQRGNGAAGLNARIDVDLAAVVRACASGSALPADALRAVRPVALGALEGVALGFTDACPLAGPAILFAAAAEASGSTYDDGAVAGSVVGWLEDDRVRATWRVAGRDKIEGLWALLRAGGLDLRLVADADDPGVRAPLYAARIEPAALERVGVTPTGA